MKAYARSFGYEQARVRLIAFRFVRSETPRIKIRLSFEPRLRRNMNIQNFDTEDIPAALERETQDGPGAEPLPPGDFVSFAESGVEKEDDSE